MMETHVYGRGLQFESELLQCDHDVWLCGLVRSDLVKKISTFRMCSDPFIKAIVSKLVPQVCLAGDYVVTQGDRPYCMYFGEMH